MQTNDVKTVYAGQTITATLTTEHDPEPSPTTDGDWATDADVAAWRRGEWGYVTLVATIYLDGIEIANEAVGAVVTGRLPGGPRDREPIVCDPFEWVGPDDATNTAGSTAWETMSNAATHARGWLTRIAGNADALNPLVEFMGSRDGAPTMDDTPILVTVTYKANLIPSAWEEEYREGFKTREQVMADVRSYFYADGETGESHAVVSVENARDVFPSGMHSTVADGLVQLQRSVINPIR